MLNISKVFSTPIARNLRNASLALAATGMLVAGATSCSGSKRNEIDPATLQSVYLPEVGKVKVQDGVSIEVNSAIYLFEDGKTKKYCKDDNCWYSNSSMNIYDYQAGVLGNIASACNEVDGELVLSKQDIKYLQRHPKKIFKDRPYRNPDNYDVNSRRGKSIDMSIGENSYDLFHYTRNFKVSYDMDKNKVLKK